MVTVLKTVVMNQWVIRESDGKWFLVTRVPMDRGREPKYYFYGKDSLGEHMLTYAECRDAYPYKCKCGEGFQELAERNRHLDEKWGDGRDPDAVNHGIVHDNP